MNTAAEHNGDFKKVEIYREEVLVKMVFHCADEYAAMMLYDKMAEHLQTGFLELELNVKNPTDG